MLSLRTFVISFMCGNQSGIGLSVRFGLGINPRGLGESIKKPLAKVHLFAEPIEE